MDIDLAQLLGVWERLLWPLLRIGAVMMSAPVLGAQFVPARVRLLLAVAMTLALFPVLPAPPVLAVFSAPWFLAVAQQLVVGVAMGFALQLVFEAVLVGGELASYGMGLSFATLADPLNGEDISALSQLFLVLATLLFLALDGHHVLILAMADSYRTLPVGQGLPPDLPMKLVQFAGQTFSGGLAIALPAVIALLVVNLSFGFVSRAAPSLNLFSIGFPLTLLFGLVVLALTLPALQSGLNAALERGWLLIADLTRAPHG